MKNSLATQIVPMIMHNGKNIQVEVTIAAEIDECFDIENDLEFEEDKEAVRRGQIDPMVVIVTATWEGLEGCDAMGACLIGKPQDVLDLVAEYGMVENALTDLKSVIENLAVKIAV